MRFSNCFPFISFLLDLMLRFESGYAIISVIQKLMQPRFRMRLKGMEGASLELLSFKLFDSNCFAHDLS
jgi:hypothetical protein